MSQGGILSDNTSPSSDVEFLTGNSGGAVGPDAAHNINVLALYTNTVSGNPGTNTLTVTPTSRGYPISQFVVGPSTYAGYQTIQAAVTAAIAAGGYQTIYVQPGTYTENLNLAGGGSLNIVGATGLGDEGQVEIVGMHTPPTTGTIVFRNFRLSSATDIFNSAAAGSSHIVIIDAFLNVTNGYTFNLLNWTGIFELFDINGGTANDGGVNNTGGASLFVFEAGLGSGTLNTMQLSGSTICQGAGLNCPINFGTGSSIQMDDCIFPNGITLSGNSSGSFFGCRIGSATLATSALTMSSSGAVGVWNSEIGSTNNPAIAGAGAGTLTLGDNTFLSNSAIAATVSRGYTTPTEVGTLYAQNISFNRGTSTVSTNGQLIIGNTGNNPSISTLTAGSNVTITNGPGTITIATTSSGNVTAALTMTDNAIIRGDGGGFGVQTSVPTIDDTGNISQSAAVAGATLSFTTANTSNTASAQALHTLSVGGGTAADAFQTFTVTGVTSWSHGVDNSASDAYVIAASTALGTTNVVNMTTTGAVSFVLGNSSTSRSAVGSAVSHSISNTDNTNGASDASCVFQTGGASAGDPFSSYTISGIQGYSYGIDNSDSDALKETNSNAGPSNGSVLRKMSSAGEQTLPLQPAFLAYQSASQTNATGAGTEYTLGTTSDLTEIFDQGSDFDPATGTFTAPVTGKYHLNSNISAASITAAMTTGRVLTVTSNRTYVGSLANPGVAKTISTVADTYTFSCHVLADMDIADTVTFSLAIFGGVGDTASISGVLSAETYVSGFLAC